MKEEVVIKKRKLLTEKIIKEMYRRGVQDREITQSQQKAEAAAANPFIPHSGKFAVSLKQLPIYLN